MGGGEHTTADQQVNHISTAGGIETIYPSANWDVVFINQRLVRDFESEELDEQVDQGSKVGLFYGRKSEHGLGTKAMIRVSHSATVKPCQSAWVDVKDLNDPSIEGTPQLLHTLIKRIEFV